MSSTGLSKTICGSFTGSRITQEVGGKRPALVPAVGSEPACHLRCSRSLCHSEGVPTQSRFIRNNLKDGSLRCYVCISRGIIGIVSPDFPRLPKLTREGNAYRHIASIRLNSSSLTGISPPATLAHQPGFRSARRISSREISHSLSSTVSTSNFQ